MLILIVNNSNKANHNKDSHIFNRGVGASGGGWVPGSLVARIPGSGDAHPLVPARATRGHHASAADGKGVSLPVR